MEKLKKHFNLISCIILLAIIIFVTFGIIPYEFGVYSYEKFSKILSFMVVPIYILFIMLKVLNKEKIKPNEIITFLIILFLYISYLNAYDKTAALYGYQGRQEGLFEIILYYGIFLVSKMLSKDYQKMILYLIFGISILEVGLGHIQHLHSPMFMGIDMTKHLSYKFLAASGTFGNPNFYSAFTLLISSYLFVYIFKNKFKSIKEKIIYIVLLLLNVYGLIISNTSSCIIVFILLVVSYYIYNMIKKHKYKSFLILLGIIGVLLTIIFTQRSLFINRIRNHLVSNFTEVTDIFKYGLNDKSFNGRVFVWKEALSSDYNKITGIGIDNFAYLNKGNYICSNEICYDKAHNEFLQIYICEGIIVFFLYLLFIIYIIYMAVKNIKKMDAHYFAIFIAVIAYLIQSFFNIRVIEVAPMVFMFMGFLLNNDIKEKNNKKRLHK